MKSIYNEALNLIENIGRNLPYTWLVGRDNLMKIKQALEQAQKQERLLELYRYLNENTISYDLSYDEEDEITSKIDEIEKQIRELENDKRTIIRTTN